MTTLPVFDNLPEVIAAARQYVAKTDRALYWPFLALIEKFAADNKCFLAGEIAIHRLTGICEDNIPCDATYEMYCDNAYPTAQRLSQEMAAMNSPFLDKRTICVQTVFKHRELILSINARVLVRIYGMERLRGKAIPDVLCATKCSAWLPVEALLVACYRAMYTGSSTWEALLDQEASLYRIWEATAKSSSQCVSKPEISFDILGKSQG